MLILKDLSNTKKDLLDQIRRDPNLKISGVQDDLLTIIDCIFAQHQDLILGSMDSIVISKMGLELLIIECEEKSEYDRSIFLDLTAYRTEVFKLHWIVALGVTVLAVTISGDELIRQALLNKKFSNR